MNLSHTFPFKHSVPGGLHPANIGDMLCDGRFELKHEHSSFYVQYAGYIAYIAKDRKWSRFVCLRIYGANYSVSPALSGELEQTKTLTQRQAPPSLLVPLDSFTIEGPNGKHAVVVYELHGPSLGHLLQFGPADDHYPADFVTKVAKDAAAGLSDLHGLGYVHGNVSELALVITYPHLDPSDEQAVLKFLGLPGTEVNMDLDTKTPEMNLPTSWRTECANHLSAKLPSSSEFQVKVQDFSKLLQTSKQPASTQAYRTNMLAPPELIFSERLGPGLDDWYLATTLALLTSPNHHFEPFRFSSTGDPIPALLAARDLLGELPDSYRSKLASPPAAPDYDADELAERMQPRQDADRDVLGWSEKRMRGWAELLKRGLRWPPYERDLVQALCQQGG